MSQADETIYYFYLGIIFTVIGSALMSTGTLLFKRGLDLEGMGRKAAVNVAFLQPSWWFGLGMYTTGALLHCVALAYAAASILAPMNSLGLVFNAAIATLCMGEKMSWLEIIGTCGIVVGVFCCAFTAILPNGSPPQTYDGLSSWTDTPYVIFMATNLALIASLAIAALTAEIRADERRWDQIFHHHLAQGHMDGVELVPLRAQVDGSVSQTITRPSYPDYVSLIYGILSGVVGAHFVLELKEFTGCIAAAYKHGRLIGIFKYYQTYIAILIGVGSSFLQMHFLNMGLGRGRSTLVVPTYYVFWTIFGTAGGIAKFHENLDFNNIQISVFGLGLALNILGLVALTSSSIAALSSELFKTLNQAETADELGRLNSKLGQVVALPFAFTLLPAGNLGVHLPIVPKSHRHSLRRTQSVSEGLLNMQVEDRAINWTVPKSEDRAIDWTVPKGW